MKPFLTDPMIAERLREVRDELLERGLRTTADKLTELILILDEETP